MKIRTALLTSALLFSATPYNAFAEEGVDSNVMFIFDSSGSMKKKIANDESRSDAAKRAMIATLAGMPSNTNLGLLMYGHRRTKDCTDIEMISPIGTANGTTIAQRIQGSKPKGETPIAAALGQAAKGFAPLAGQSNSIVLVTDGIEECGGDPCAAARAIRDSGLGLKAHVVGFTLNAQQRQTVQCIADETGGKYFDAQNATGLSEALAEVQKEVVEAPPVAPTFISLFADEFEGTTLQGLWKVLNVSQDQGDDAHAVGNGELLISIARAKSDDPSQTPYYVLDGFDLPATDWTAQAIVDFGIQTAQETFAVQNRKDNTTISAELVAKGDEYYGWTLYVRIDKMAGSEATGFEVPVATLGCNVCKKGRMLQDFAAQLKQPIELQLVKEGRSYFARARQTGDTDWISTEKVTLLTGGGKLGLSGIQRKANTGESYAFVKRFEVLAPQ